MRRRTTPGLASFRDLFDLEEIQAIQDTFARITRVSSVITDPDGRSITSSSNFCNRCGDVTNGSACRLVGARRDSDFGACAAQGVTVLPRDGSEHWAGCARIRVGDRHVANWFIGRRCDRDAEVMNEERFHIVCESLGRVAELLSRQAHRTLVLQAIVEAKHAAETERDRLDDHLRQAAKLEALGRLAGGVAHDFNNLLTAVNGFTELLQAEVADRPDAVEIIEHLFGVTRRASEMVRDLLDFARHEQHRSEPVGINDVVRNVRHLLARSIDPRIEMQLRLEGEEPVVIGDTTQIQNAILNLCLNARDAMAGGGRLTVTTRNCDLDADACRLHPSVKGPGRFLELSVADTGAGMDAATRERIFEPFFTTKPHGAGTGLGLAVVYSCVKAHCGGVDVVSAPGGGTTITLLLPLAVGAVARAAPVPRQVVPALAPAAGSGRVLVVDDEDPVRLLVEKIFVRAGYSVTSCRDGVDALEAWKRADGAFDLVVLDLVMPRLTGEEVLAVLMAERPTTRVLVMSGFCDGGTRGRVLDIGARAFLAKPFRPSDLMREASRILSVATPAGSV